MDPASYDPNYNPSNFVRDYPDDPELQRALKMAEDLSATIPRQLPEESALDAERRIDTAFHHLSVEIDEQLDSFHRGERSGIKKQFLEERKREIIAEYQKGIDSTNDPNLKMGGQFARDEKLRMLEENIDSNPDLKTRIEEVTNFQAVRSEAISHAIKYTPPEDPDLPKARWESEEQYQKRVQNAAEHAEIKRQLPQSEIKPQGPVQKY